MHWYLPRLLSSPVVAKHNFQVNVSFRATTASGYKMVLQDMPLSSPLPITDIGEIPVMPHILCHSQSFSPSVVSSTLQLNSRSQNCYFNTIESLTLTHNLFTITLTVTPPKTSRPPTWLTLTIYHYAGCYFSAQVYFFRHIESWQLPLR